jgi:hypothetical protein
MLTIPMKESQANPACATFSWRMKAVANQFHFSPAATRSLP